MKHFVALNGSEGFDVESESEHWTLSRVYLLLREINVKILFSIFLSINFML